MVILTPSGEEHPCKVIQDPKGNSCTVKYYCESFGDHKVLIKYKDDVILSQFSVDVKKFEEEIIDDEDGLPYLLIHEIEEGRFR